MHMKSLPPSKPTLITACLILAGIFYNLTCTAPAHAWWFNNEKKKQEQEAVEKVQTYQPPPPEALTEQCEPIRAKVVAINQKFILVRPFYIPKRTWLIHEHQKCRHEFMSQEYTYLKHADIEKAPSLPKITPNTPSTGVPNGNLP